MKRLRIVLALLLLHAAPLRVAHAGFDWQGAVDADAEGLQSDDPAAGPTTCPGCNCPSTKRRSTAHAL